MAESPLETRPRGRLLIPGWVAGPEREHIGPPAPGTRVVAYRYGRRDSVVRRFLAATDSLAVALGLAMLAFVPAHHHPVRIYLLGLCTIPIWLVLFKCYGLYDRDIRRIHHSTVDDVPWIFHSLVIGCLLLWAYYGVLPHMVVEFNQFAAFAAVSFVLMLALRATVRLAIVRLIGQERMALVGNADELALLARKLRCHPEYGARPIGFVTQSDDPADALDLPLLGRLDTLDLPGMVAKLKIERIVVAHQDVAEETMLGLIRDCREVGVKVSLLPRMFDAIGSSVEIDDVEGVTVLGMNPPVLSRSSRAIKRGLDILGAVLLLVLTAPLQLAVAVAVLLDDGRPLLFRQPRVGRLGQKFQVLKFRSMCRDAEAQREALLVSSRDPDWLLLDRDPRITRIGGLLRRASLDELPQLWNVLRGEMSLVGPRPLIESEAEQLIGWRKSRVDLKPGLTGLWQVLGRTNIPFDEMVKLDYLYVTNWSLWNDIGLLLRTLPVVFRRRGAN